MKKTTPNKSSSDQSRTVLGSEHEEKRLEEAIQRQVAADDPSFHHQTKPDGTWKPEPCNRALVQTNIHQNVLCTRG